MSDKRLKAILVIMAIALIGCGRAAYKLNERCEQLEIDNELLGIRVDELRMSVESLDRVESKNSVEIESYVEDIDSKKLTYKVNYVVYFDNADSVTKVVLKDELDNEIVLDQYTDGCYNGIIEYSMENYNVNAYVSVLKNDREVAYGEIGDCGLLYSDFMSCYMPGEIDDEVMNVSNGKLVAIGEMTSFYRGNDIKNTEFYFGDKKVYKSKYDNHEVFASINESLDLSDRNVTNECVEFQDIYARVETDCGTVYEIYPEIQQWDENGIWYRQESAIKVTGSNNKEIIIKGILSKY